MTEDGLAWQFQLKIEILASYDFFQNCNIEGPVFSRFIPFFMIMAKNVLEIQSRLQTKYLENGAV